MGGGDRGTEYLWSMERTEISALGEFGLIRHLTSELVTRQPSTLLGVGDDAAVIDAGDKRVLVSTDMLCEGVHFDLAYTPLKHLGYKAIVVNLSDICAMNALPTQVTVSLALSNRFSLEAVEELYAGMLKACELYQVDLIGGDTTTSRAGLVISVTALGLASSDRIVRRSGAKPGDLLVVSGELGGAYMGLQVLEREKHVFQEAPGAQPDLVGFDYVLERQLKPEARFDVVRELLQLKVKPTAMIDISDGLSSEIFHVCTESGVGVKVFEEKLPIHPEVYEAARAFNVDPTVCMLNGGEDYELLFTIAQKDVDQIRNHPMFSIIGYLTDDPKERRLIAKNGAEVDLEAQGWQPFKAD